MVISVFTSNLQLYFLELSLHSEAKKSIFIRIVQFQVKNQKAHYRQLVHH